MKTLDRIRIRIRIETYVDPKHCLKHKYKRPGYRAGQSTLRRDPLNFFLYNEGPRTLLAPQKIYTLFL
jgi:hypothetical protein